MEIKDKFKEFIVAQTVAGLVAVISGIIGLTLIYKMSSGFSGGFFSILFSKIAIAGLAILAFNFILSYYGLKNNFNKVENIPGAKLMITVITFMWLTIVTVISGAVWL